jgi:hypothetical protein
MVLVQLEPQAEATCQEPLVTKPMKAQGNMQVGPPITLKQLATFAPVEGWEADINPDVHTPHQMMKVIPQN